MFMLRRLEPAERHYTNTEQEVLAIVRLLREVKWLVHGSPYPIKVYKDHSALKTFLMQDHAQSWLPYWQVKLPRYDFEYVHMPGCRNQVADGLNTMPSRFFGDQGDQNKEEDGIAWEQGDVLGDGVDRQEGGKLIRTGINGREQGELEIANQEDEEQEVNGSERVEGWEKWLQSGWYRGIVLFLPRGSLEEEGLTAREQWRIREQSRR